MRRKEEEGGRRLSFAQHRPVSEHFASWAPPPNHLLSHCKQRKRKPALASFRGFWSDTHTCLESSYASNIKLLETYKLTIELTIEPSSSHGNTLYKRLRTLCNHSECVNISDKSSEKCLWSRATEPLKVMHSSSDLLFPSTWPLQRVPVQYGHVCYVNTLNRSTLTSTECLAFNMTWYHGNWMLRKGSILEYTSPWIHGENVQDHNMLGLEECPSNKTNKLPQLGRHLSCRKILYITVLLSVLVKIVLVSYSIAYDVSNSWCS